MRRKGFTTTELAFVLAIAAILMIVGLMAFNKMYTPSVANSEYSKAMQVIGAAERAAADNAGAFPTYAAATAITVAAAPNITNQMGGNVADLAGWTYGCAAGDVTVITGALTSAEVTSLLAKKITSSSPNWIATADSVAKKVTMKKSGITCN